MKRIFCNNHKQGYHLVDPRPWSLIAAFSALMTSFGGVFYMYGYIDGDFLFRFGFLMILFMMFGCFCLLPFIGGGFLIKYI